MAIGAINQLDKRLAQMYSDKQTSNHDLSSKIDPEMVWQGMSMLALNNKASIQINNNKIKINK